MITKIQEINYSKKNTICSYLMQFFFNNKVKCTNYRPSGKQVYSKPANSVSLVTFLLLFQSFILNIISAIISCLRIQIDRKT
ncbi:hypothetical protein BpHYR1_041424 [Brachionus plicatilis]|uniref:Uncharacterized protein n=1 Tax=Brachionus plicatilis TaxID=10195 RepID=A0A3M7SCV3_BRAPC|nr:hypothetical protein BpHYR1_041424 [Brachionus plicatilis]